jgi:lipoprotein-anchoring transpeptidase ErfK/SrfK
LGQRLLLIESAVERHAPSFVIESHGCVRLTNWDAEALGKMVLSLS